MGDDGVDVGGDQAGKIVGGAVEREDLAEPRPADCEIPAAPDCDWNKENFHASNDGRARLMTAAIASCSLVRSAASHNCGQLIVTGMSVSPPLVRVAGRPRSRWLP